MTLSSAKRQRQLALENAEKSKKAKIEEKVKDDLENEILRKDDVVNAKQAELNEKQAELNEKQAELNEKRAELNGKQAELDEKRAELNEKQAELDEKRAELDERQAELEIICGKLVKKTKEYNELKKTEKELRIMVDFLHKDRRFWYKKVWQINKSRGKWKNKRKPSKKTMKRPRRTILSAEQDLRFTVDFNLTGRNRWKLKALMRRFKIDFLAKNKDRDALINRISPKESWTYEKVIGKRGVLYKSNIEKEIDSRLERLKGAEKFNLDENAEDLYACIIGDKGGGWTKIGLFLLDVENSNDPDNLSLLCLYNGKDSADELRLFCYEVFTQLNQINGKKYRLPREDGTIHEVTLKFVLAGDMPFLVNIYGLPSLWSMVQFCLFCTATKRKPGAFGEEKTLTTIMNDFRSGKQVHFPALCIPIENVVPSILHIFLGLASDYFKRIEEIAKEIDAFGHSHIYDEIEEVLAENRIEKKAWFMVFNGNQIKKLIGTPAILDEIRKLFPAVYRNYESVCYYVDLLLTLGEIQKCSKAKFLTPFEEVKLMDSIRILKEKVFMVDKPNITPKMHWLLLHVDEFVIRHGFWGLASEQPIENLHHKINHDMDQFSAIKDEEMLFRQIAIAQDSRNFFFDTKN